MVKKAASAGTVEIRPFDVDTVSIRIKGVTPLIVHKWSDKAKQMMLDTQMGKAKAKRPLKDPEQDYEDSMYKTEDGSTGFPATGFKAAIVGACRMIDGLPMTQAKIAIRVNGDIVKINGQPRMREDMVRLQTGVADIRYRAEYPEWSATLSITYNKGMISLEQLVNLLNAAGFGGIGEWRPSAPKSASGSYGCFEVVTA